MHDFRVASFLSLLAVVLTVSLAPVRGFTQTYPDNPWHINANAGATILFGDLTEQDNLTGRIPDDLEPGFGIRAGRNISTIFGIYLQGITGKFKGSNESRNLEFNTSFTETGLGVRASLTDLILGKKDRFVNFYGFVGTSAVFFKSEARNSETGEIVNVHGYTDDGSNENSSPETGIVFPIGVGFDFKLHQRWFLSLEAGFRASLTDKLDGLIKGSQNDAYYYSSFGLSYYFKLGSPKPPKPPPAVKPLTEPAPFAGTYIDLKYQIPSDLSSYDEFKMKSIIHKGHIDGKAQLIQILPIGFNLLDTVVGGASRTEFNNYTLRLYWDELPQDTAFEVSYDVKLDQIFGTLPMASILYIDKTGQEYRFKTDIMIKRKIIEDLFAELEEEDVDIEKIMTAVELVEFKVQIAASFRKQLSISELEKKHNLQGQIIEEVDGPWYKYVTGTYSTYEKVREHRADIIKDHGVSGAFVVVYYKGDRLSNIKELISVAPEHYPIPVDPMLLKRSPLCYRVQILALRESDTSPYSLKQTYNIDDVVNEEIYHNWKKYTVGDCLTKQAALQLTNDLKNKGINGAFPVLYKDGERSPMVKP